MSELPPFPSNPADLPQWVADLTDEQQQTLLQQGVAGTFLADAAARLGIPEVADPFAAFDRRNPEIELPAPPTAPSAYTLRIDIVGAKPPIWRRIAVRSDVTLDALHRVLQATFGWWDGHLHRFSLGDPYTSPYFTTPADLYEGEEGTPEEAARLDQVLTEVGGRLTYEYDFGDGWTHRILLESSEPWPEDESRTAWCLTGRRAGPLEDSGGIWGYAELADWVRSGFAEDRAPDNAEDLADWIPDGFDPDHFSVAETDQAIESALLGDVAVIARSLGAHDGLVDLARRLPRGDEAATVARWLMSARLAGVGPVDVEAAQAATSSWRVLMRQVGDGVTLTKAGYLPPAVVEAVYDELDLAERWIGKGSREDQTYPVLELREQAQALGLLRKAKGSLTPTAKGRRLAEDPVGMLTHVAGRLPLGRHDDEQDAGWLVLLATAAGEERAATDEQLAVLLHGLGWRTTHGALEPYMAAHSARPTQAVLWKAGGGLGLDRSSAPSPGAVLLARLALVSSGPSGAGTP